MGIVQLNEDAAIRLEAGAGHLAGRWALIIDCAGRPVRNARGNALSGLGTVLTVGALRKLRDDCTRALGEHHGSGPDFITISQIDVVHFECASPTEPQVPHVTLCYGTCVRCGMPVQLGDKCVDVPRMTSEGAPR
jgi:hypothetical protein